MEDQAAQSVAQEYEKADKVLAKNASLIEEKKFYEYGQRIKSHAFRAQGNTVQMVRILSEGSKNLLKNGELEGGFDLANAIIEVLTKQNKEVDEATKSVFLSIYSVSPYCKQRMSFINKVIHTFFKKGDEEIYRTVAISLMNDGRHHLAQKYLIHLKDFELSHKLLQNWLPKINNPKLKEFLVFRFIILKLASEKIEEATKLEESFRFSTPLGNCLKLLIKACNLRSKQAFTVILNSYTEILRIDPSFKEILQRVGAKYFGLQQPAQASFFDGILSLFSE